MKRYILKYILAAFVLVGLTQSCVKESFEGDNVGDSGTTFLKTPNGGEVIQWLSPSESVRKVKLFTLFKDAHNAAELARVNTVKLTITPALIDEYNEENETELEPLPSDFFTWVQENGISVSGNTISIELGNGNAYGELFINLDGSKWTDMSTKYALAFVISDYGDITPSSQLSDTIIVQLGLKNMWDGIYKFTGTLTDVVTPTIEHVSIQYAAQGYGDYTVELHTIGETKVVLFDDILWGGNTYPIYSGGWSGYGSFCPVFEFDPETNKIISVTNYYGQPASNTRSAKLDPSGENYYDPETKTLKVRYFMLQPNMVPAAPYIRATIDEEYKFVGARK